MMQEYWALIKQEEMDAEDELLRNHTESDKRTIELLRRAELTSDISIVRMYLRQALAEIRSKEPLCPE